MEGGGKVEEEISIILGIIGQDGMTIEDAQQLQAELPGIIFFAEGFIPERARILRVEVDGDQIIATCLPIPDERILDATEAFRYMVEQGKQLMDTHLNYEQSAEYPLEWQWTEPRSWHVEKMRFSQDRSSVIVNESLTLAGIPPEAHEYVLGDRSALEWVIDQYKVTTDKRSGIVSDPNKQDDPEYIARLVCKVVAVSVETVRITKELARRVNFDDFELVGPDDSSPLNQFWTK